MRKYGLPAGIEPAAFGLPICLGLPYFFVTCIFFCNIAGIMDLLSVRSLVLDIVFFVYYLHVAY